MPLHWGQYADDLRVEQVACESVARQAWPRASDHRVSFLLATRRDGERAGVVRKTVATTRHA